MSSFSMEADLIVQRVNTKWADVKNGRRSALQGETRPAAYCMDTGQQLCRKEGFIQVVVGARFQATNFIMHVSRIREDKQQCIMLTLHFPAHCQCISTLHCRIQDNKLRSLLSPQQPASLRCISTMDFVPKSFQPPCEHLYQITITIHHHDFHHSSSLPPLVC